MALRLIYKMLSTLLGWIVLRTRSDTSKEIEILVLRHQLGSDAAPADRGSAGQIAALSLLLPTRRRLGLLVPPATILRWHRELVSPAAGPLSPSGRVDRSSPPACAP